MVDAIEFVADNPSSTLVLMWVQGQLWLSQTSDWLIEPYLFDRSGDVDFAYLLGRARMRRVHRSDSDATRGFLSSSSDFSSFPVQSRGSKVVLVTTDSATGTLRNAATEVMSCKSLFFSAATGGERSERKSESESEKPSRPSYSCREDYPRQR